MKYLSIQTFQCGISVSGAATFTGGATINLLALNGATTSSEASLFLGAHSALEGGQLVLQKGTSQTYAAHIDNYSDQFRVMYGTNTGSAGVALAVSLATRQLILPAYTSDTSFSGSPAGYLAFDSAGNIITTSLTLSGFVPTSRTLTINGVSYDLSANRSWTIATVGYTSKLQHQVKAGVSITKGQAVYVTSADGTNMIVGLASNVSEATSSKTMGLLDATVSTNGFANVITEGLLDGLDTSTAGAAGDPVWLGTGGNLIYGLGSKPYAPAHLVFIGIVTRKNASNGEIFVKVQNGFELKEIHDVDLFTTTPVNGHILGFDGTLWVNKTVASWLGYTPANASGTTNYISKFTGSSALGNSQIYDDGSNVGIGTTTMYGKLSISSGNSNGIRIDTNGGGYSALNIGGTGALTVDAPGITGGRFQITDSGNVGIGTPSPSHNLHIYGAGDRLIKIENTGTYLMYVGLISNEGYIGSTNATSLGFYTNSVNRIYINTSGNIGIGTTSPAYKFQVAGGDIAIDYNRYLRGGSGGDWNLVNLYNGGTGDIEITMLNANWYLRHNANASFAGKVGIGTTSPSAKLHIGESGAAAQLWLQRTDGYNPVKLIGGTLADGNGFKITMNTTDAFSITSAGNVGIGTTSPNRTLSVNGIVGISSATSNTQQLVFSVDSGASYITSSYFGSSSYVPMYLEAGGNVRLAILTNGNIGIGTTSPSTKLHAVGSSTTELRLQNSDANNNYGFVKYETSVAGVGGNLVIGTNASGGGYGAIGFSNNNNVEFVGNGDLYLVKSGNVGIGTYSPTHKLTVVGDGLGTMKVGGPGVSGNYTGISLNGSLDISNYNILSSPTDNHLYINRPTGNNIYFRVNNNDQVIINSSGNVGIGTSSPSRALNIVSNNAQIRISDNTAPTTNYWEFSSIFFNTNQDLFISNQSGTAITLNASLNVGIGTTLPATKLDVSGVITATGGNSTNWNTAYGWGNHSSAGYVPQARTLTINGTTYDLSANRSWTIATTTPGGSDTQFQYNSSGSLAGASALTYNSTTNRVGINQASPGYDLDVNGQVRVQDKLRVGTVNSGNGVVHMSSTATINANTTTIVWAQNVSVGMCAFIEYYILNGNTFTDQRAGTIIVTWNQTGTPTIAHTETTTPDIGSTTTINFTSTLVGSDARINAVSSSPHPYTMVMSFKYF